MNDKVNPINIELSDEVAQGIYSNLAIITHSSSEFIIDFVRIMPGMPKAQVKTRVILTPDHAKRLLLALQDNMAKFEANMGTIKLPEGSEGMPPFPMNFGGKGGEA
ncbi:MAG: DUF3467 domain-containing protein [Tenuifilum sp.]|mgnify:FL=1|uniref:DUF3467 domain-containing protein n=1 Tax=Tenuifilum TaxID=2760873 RepID=UPI0019AC2475|nr:DUF3467 domain-containing protein [Bacteroidales bacterium]HOK60905.1 DUF3467 domain-containing protein [Tenuifilum sp.]MBP7169425.1 DUF3467 domain-containing protein [Bacteroidales bacterium]MBP9029734.1 DUF3467 domain-containing protein [Bacteroidales bacterium]HOK86093.1 DUF3467 domain-containing protein [Tenuifilum sp.]